MNHNRHGAHPAPYRPRAHRVHSGFAPSPSTGNDVLDRCRRIAEMADHVDERWLAAKWHDIADQVSAGVPGACEKAEAMLPPTARPMPSDLDERLRMEHAGADE